ncbi:MAG: triose-phosphate isomerase [Verrucomicrobia bacterium]|nr:triose-phosphate isomerase [Verrucomicrobiota bacterium]
MKLRRPVIAGNWKMHKTVHEAEGLVKDLILELPDVSNTDVVLCPPFTALYRVAELVSKTSIRVGAQDMHWEKEGAYTGEISATMLRGVYCRYVILGHSERRQYFGETNQTVNRKAKTAMAANLRPIVCVGETLEQREKQDFKAIVRSQVIESLDGIPADQSGELILAYEPVWAIGTGRNATPAQAQEVHALIRSILVEIYGVKQAKKVRIQYGGSVKPANAAELLSQPDIDGALVGGASLEARGFAAIVRAAS